VVVALQQSHVVGVGPDDGDALQLVGVQRQHPVVGEKAHTPRSRRARERAVFRGVEALRRARGFDVWSVEQPEPELLGEDSLDRGVDRLLVEPPTPNERGELPVVVEVRELDVESGSDGLQRGVGTVDGRVVVRVQLHDGEVVRHHGAVEAQLAAKEIRQDFG
jgi:hypothetical protein